MPRWSLGIALALLLTAMLAGAWQLRFLCDDAYITFRYVANAHDGLGLVWNPPPFQPVEGYTCFSWALMLWATWSWFGTEPPDAANVLSLLCGVLQFGVVAAAALRLRHRDGRPAAPAVGLVALATIVGNRTFLQWQTSGLETPLFNLMFVTWAVLAFRAPAARGTAWRLVWSGVAAGAALTRPDGLLLVAATGAVVVAETLWHRRAFVPALLGLLPLATVAAHIVWRRAFYGEWLPNTYYAKVVTAWPEAGLRYLACFVLEHGVWLWLPLALVWVVVAARRLVASFALHLPAFAAVGTVLFQVGYYVLEVGGDHFEYRVFSQLVPLGVLAAAAMLVQLANGTRMPIVGLLCLWLAAGVGWLHLAITHDMPAHGFRPVASSLPAAVRPLAHWFDRQQAWLLFRNIGLRCNHHAILLRRFQRDFPHRMWIRDAPDPFPVYHIGAVGSSGWCLPDCVLLDHHGLNDWVVARTPVHAIGAAISSEILRPLVAAADVDHDGLLDRTELRAAIGALGGGTADDEAGDYLVLVLMTIYAREHENLLTLAEAEGIGDSLAGARSMAHERHPPPGYVEAFEPNVVVQGGIATARPRAVPLTAERVRALEAEWRAWVLAQRQ